MLVVRQVQEAGYSQEVRVLADCFQEISQRQLVHHQISVRSEMLVCTMHYQLRSPLRPPTALADVDPLGVNQNVTFDEVGGLDDRMHLLNFPTADSDLLLA